MQRKFGQVDIKTLITTILASVIIGVASFLWQNIRSSDSQFASFDKRLTRIEEALERISSSSKGHK